jgi:hypothetical protein
MSWKQWAKKQILLAKSPLYKSCREVGVNAVFALTPVWAGVLISLIFLEGHSLSESISINTARGDLFILATAVVAPVALYITTERGKLPKPFSIHFPAGWAFIIAILIVFFVAAILFSIKRMSDSKLLGNGYDSGLLQTISIWTYFVSIAIALVVTFIRFKMDQTTPQDLRENDREFLNEWLNRDVKGE